MFFDLKLLILSIYIFLIKSSYLLRLMSYLCMCNLYVFNLHYGILHPLLMLQCNIRGYLIHMCNVDAIFLALSDSCFQLMTDAIFVNNMVSSRDISIILSQVLCSINDLKCCEGKCENCQALSAVDASKIRSSVVKYFRWDKIIDENNYSSTRCVSVRLFSLKVYISYRLKYTFKD